MRSWKIATVLELVAGIMPYAVAQSTNVTCLREFQWVSFITISNPKRHLDQVHSPRFLCCR